MAANLPPAYKPIAHYLKIAQEHANRDPAIYYWAKYYALQKAMQIDRKSPDCVKFLTSTLAELENLKKAHRDNEAITNDVVGQAHIEEMALKLFLFADNQDRNGVFNKNIVKAFYTSGHLLDILSLFGEMEEKIAENCKYAKFKAAYIHNCLKNGETPVAGPMGADGQPLEGFDDLNINAQQPGEIGFNVPQMPNSANQPYNPPPAPSQAYSAPAVPENTSSAGGGAHRMDVYVKAQKLCKQAASALDFEDEKTAIENLTKALNLLQG